MALVILLIAMTLFIDIEQKKGGTLAELFTKYGKDYDIPPNLLKAIAKVESDFNPKAINVNVNLSRDLGLMQINSKNLAKLGLNEQTAFDPEQSIRAASSLLKSIKHELGNLFSTMYWISAYNQGSHRTLREGIVNLAYTSKVFFYYSIYGGNNV